MFTYIKNRIRSGCTEKSRHRVMTAPGGLVLVGGSAAGGCAAGLAALSLRGLLVVLVLLDVLGESFFFAELLEATHHLLGGLVAA